MLKRLSIRNYVLIDSLETDFPEGLVIITGQTGAGKSILLGALSLLLGAKADASMIGESSDNCVVEGDFSVDDDEILNTLMEVLVMSKIFSSPTVTAKEEALSLLPLQRGQVSFLIYSS